MRAHAADESPTRSESPGHVVNLTGCFAGIHLDSLLDTCSPRRLIPVSVVVFAIGSKPGLSATDAEAPARVLELGRNLVAVQLAGRIRHQARFDPDRLPASKDIELDRGELGQIAAVFADGPDLLMIPAFAHLHDEVVAALHANG